MKISKYFTLNEFLSSETAMRHNIKEQYNPSQQVIKNLSDLATNIADPIRDKFGAFSPTVAYRCEMLNKIVGGAKKSEHLKGMAFDETFIKNGENICNDVAKWLIYESNLKWSKLILEYPYKENGIINYKWLHIGYDTENLRNNILICKPNVFGIPKYEEYRK